jgi:hypothetical protein
MPNICSQRVKRTVSSRIKININLMALFFIEADTYQGGPYIYEN